MRFFSKILFLILLIFMCAVPEIISNDTLKYNIKWLPSIPSWLSADSASGKVLLNFENAKHNLNGIPVFIKSLPVEDNCTEVKIRIISYSCDTIPLTDKYSSSNNIPVVLSFTANVLKEEKKNFAQITIVPVIRKDQKLLLLKEFTAELIKSRKMSSKKSAVQRWKNVSVLNTGTWKKIAINKTGIYKISYAEIKNLGFSNPSEIRIFGNGGDMLPEKFTDNKTDDLNEIPVFLFKGADGNFNEGDYILFFATGPIAWNFDAVNKKFVHSKHYYTDKVYYFLTTGANGMKVSDIQPLTSAEDIVVNSFLDYDVHEENTSNLIKSGRNWVGEHFSLQASRNFSFSFPDPVENSQMSIDGELLARSGINTGFTVRHNNQNLVSLTMNRVYTLDETSNHADVKTFNAKSTITGKDVAININYENRGDISADAWLNFISINAKRKLKFNGDQLLFRDTTALLLGKTALYTIDNASSSLLLWEVSHLNKVRNIPYNLSGQQASFKALTDSLRTFIAFDPSKALTPEYLSQEKNTIQPQNLHSAANLDMVIIAHQSLLAEAETLADIHRNHDNLTVLTVTPEQIYNEFSSGNPDPAAYRNFMKMLYDKASKPEYLPKYLLLFGDGSYKNLSGENDVNNTNLILTYQSVNSIRPVSSYVSDDYFGLLDDNESIEAGLLDIGIGRFPVSTPQQARAIVNKIKKYISASSSGNWRNNICFIADDEDGNIHMSQADQMSSFVNTNFPSYNLIKLYSDAYPQIITSGGPRYPEMNKSIENTLNRGILIVNYTGHGGKQGLAHEQIVRHEEVRSWNNTFYPLFVTATCEFSRFDDYETTTAGESVLLNENGGGIALLTTTRLVYSGPNFILNQEFYKNFSGKDSTGKPYRLGDLLKRTKNSSGSDINKLCFTLLGDPALQLAYPRYNVQTTHINETDVASLTDTLKAYKEVSVKGVITDYAGSRNSSFNGIIYPSLYDKELTVNTLNNDNGQPFSFRQQESLLYKGKATVKNGEFEFSFVVPREIAYNYGNGKLSYYATSPDNTDAAGYFNQFILGGVSSESNTDNLGPVIKLYMNDTTFQNGGMTHQYPTLLADLSDDNGINISGTSIGHNITATLDNNSGSSFLLNSYFESAIDNYKNGSITYKLPKLKPGKHTLSLKAWDIFNNSGVAEIVFEVSDSSILRVSNLYNYPNPFSESTTIVFEHNQPGKNLDAELQVFDITGKMVNSERMNIFSDGFTSGPIEWSAKTNYFKKLEKGIYIYRFILRYNGGEIVSESKKMIVSE